MSITKLDAKIKIKRSTITTEVPTIGPSADHTDGTWSATDIYSGEYFLNEADSKLWLGVDTAVVEIDLTGGVAAYDALYTGFITQSSIGAPSMLIPANGNTIGSIVWTRDRQGVYTGILADAFPDYAVCSLVQSPYTFQPCGFFQIGRLTSSTIQIRTFNASGALADGMLAQANIKIETYSA